MAKNIKGITVEIGGDTTKLGKAIQSVDQDTRGLQKELRGVNTLLKYDPKNVTLLQQKQELLTKSVEGTREKLNTLKDAQVQVQEQFDKGEITEEQYRDFQREIAFTEQKLKTYETQLGEVSKEHRTLEQSLDMTSEKMKKVGGTMQDVGGEMTKKLSVPLLAIAGLATKVGIDFEKSMSEVQAVSGATEEQMIALEASAREAGATTDKSASESAEALKYMALAGWSVEQSQSALLPILKLSSASSMELGRTSDLVTDTMSVLGLGTDDLSGYLDILAQTSRNSNTDVDMLGEAFLSVGGKLTMLGVDAEEGAVALGILANNGIKGSEAGTGLNAVLTNLTAPTGRAKTALDELGISAFDQNGEFIGIEETLGLVENATKGMTQEQQNSYLSMIAGKEHAKTLNALMSGLGGGFEDLGVKVGGADGALNDMYDTATNNTKGSLDNLSSAVEELGLTIFENLKPAIDFVVGILQKLIDWLNNLSPRMKQVVVIVGMIVASIGPLLMIIGTLVIWFGAVVGAMGKIMVVVKAVGVAFTAFTSGALAPVIAVIAGVVIAVIAIIAIIKNWGAITTWLSNLWGGFITWFKNIFGGFKNWVVTLFTGMGSGLMGAITGIPARVMGVFNSIKDKILTPLRNINLGTIGRDIMMGLVGGITNSIGAVTDVVKNVAGSIAGGFKKFLGIKSPSRLMRDAVGKMIPQGIAVGIEADTGDALNAVDDMNKKMMIANDVERMGLMGGNSTGSQISKMSETASGSTNNLNAKIDNLVGTINKMIATGGQNYQIVLDDGTLVGALAPEMDRALGLEQRKRNRGIGK